MDLNLKYNIYPNFELEEIINLNESSVDYIIEKSRNLISGECWDIEGYIATLYEKFKEINNLLGLFPDMEVVEGVLRFNLSELTKIDKYQEFKIAYNDNESNWFEVEVNAEIDLKVFKSKYDKYIAFKIEE